MSQKNIHKGLISIWKDVQLHFGNANRNNYIDTFFFFLPTLTVKMKMFSKTLIVGKQVLSSY